MKKTDLPYKQEPIATSHLYRMVLRPNNTVKVVIDGEDIYEGYLKDDWEFANPEFQDDDEAYKYEDLSYVGIDIWQASGGSIFDNIIVTNKLREADAFARKWKMLSKAEVKKRDAWMAKTKKDMETREAEEHDPDFDDMKPKQGKTAEL